MKICLLYDGHLCPSRLSTDWEVRRTVSFSTDWEVRRTVSLATDWEVRRTVSLSTDWEVRRTVIGNLSYGKNLSAARLHHSTVTSQQAMVDPRSPKREEFYHVK